LATPFSDKIIQFYASLEHSNLHTGDVVVMNPYKNEDVKKIIRQFHIKFFKDTNSRIALFGINPGRFGAGITGIPFTDPINLEQKCGLTNRFAKKPELSSMFVYQLIDEFGGVQEFYRHFFLSAVCPLGFTMDGKNLNYYDTKDLYANTRNFIITSIERQIDMGIRQDVCFSLGKGKNLQVLEQLNSEKKWFKKIIPLGHPRWVMQYRRKLAGKLQEEYCKRLREFV